jgi:signal peptidase I
VFRKVVAAALLVVSVGGLAHLRTFPPMATVMSESMAPTIDVGDIVLFKSLGGAPPAVGDVVEVSVPAELQREHGYPGRVIHRVVAVNDDGTVTTKGDNLDGDDPFATSVDAIDRKVAVTVPMAGRALGFLFSPFGLVWLGIGLVVFAVRPFYEVQRERADLQRSEVAALGELAATAVAAPTTADERIEDLVAAINEYGQHLRSHTAVVRSMSDASRDLADVVARLQGTGATAAPVPVPAPPTDPIADVAARVLVALAPMAAAGRHVVLADAVAMRTVPPMTRGEALTGLHHLAVTGAIELEPVAPATYRFTVR